MSKAPPKETGDTPSFSALIPHLPTANFDVELTALLLVAGALGAFADARVTSLYVPGDRLRQLFGILMVSMTLYKIYTLRGRRDR